MKPKSCRLSGSTGLTLPALGAMLAVALLNSVSLPVLGQQAGGFETPPVLQAADLVGEELLQGPHHQLDPDVRNDGFMNHFVVRSDFGDFAAESQELLAIRVREVAALAELADISRGEAFADALARSVARPVTAVKNLATDPVDTVKGIPEGLSTRFRGMYYKAKKTGRKVKKKVEEKLEDEPAAETEDDEGTESGSSAKESSITKEAAVEKVKKVAGWDSAKRELARSLRIDPYSTNPVLQAELERLASAAFAGGLTFKLARPRVGGISQIEDVNSLVWETPLVELERRNDKALKAMGIDGATRFAFFDNGRITLSLQTRMVEALGRMSPADGRDVLVSLAAGVETELEARFFAGAADLLAGYHTHIGPLRELVAAGNDERGRVLAGVAVDGTLVVAAPVDYLIWQEGMEGGGPLSSYDKRQLWITGSVSERAEQELSSRGWEVRTEVSWDS